MDLLLNPEIWIAFFTLTALELVLGIDNIIFISIVVDKLPKEQREFARKVGLFLAMFMRIGLLLVLSHIVGMTEPLFTLFDAAFSGRDVILISGGLFLVWKSTMEVHQLLEGEEGEATQGGQQLRRRFIMQIIRRPHFSLDSIITAVGMVREVEVMIAAVIVSVGLMMLFAAPSANSSRSTRPSRCWLSFLVVVGVVLLADGSATMYRRLHLLRHGVLGHCRNAQHPPAQRYPQPVDLREAYIPEKTPHQAEAAPATSAATPDSLL